MGQTGCDVNDVKKPSSLDARDLIELVAGTSIGIDVEKTPDKTIYTINYREYSPVSITVTQNVSIAKVGTIVPTVTFNGNIVKGSEDIVSRGMTPDKGLDLEVPFSWTETNVTGLVPGLFPQFSELPTEIEAIDFKATKVIKQVGVEFRHLFYMGYSNKGTLTEADVKTLGNTYEKTLLTSIKSKYSSYEYDYRGFTTYLYWVYPIGTPEIISAFEGAQNVPLYINPTPLAIEDSGVTTAYRVVRTAVPTKFLKSIIKLV